ncbi:MAG: PspC domain-containing protein [Chloroflexi bacterium]|nr:PspC domain-containing protein [Chloroflexota bacterium]
MKKLYRSRSDSVIAGVAGGLGAYFGVDPVFLRVLFVLLTVAGEGIGLLFYILMVIVVPRVPKGEEITRASVPLHENRQAGLIGGSGLIFLGLFLFVDNLNLSWLNWVEFGTLWPLLLVLGGVTIVVRQFRGV